MSKEQKATYQDIIELPEHLVGELIDGKLYSYSHTPVPFVFTRSRLLSLLGAPFHLGKGGPGSWQILYSPELHLGEDVLVPDVCGYRKSRLPRIPNLPFFELAPDWVGEVVTPAIRDVDRERKLPVYAKAKVEWLWMLDIETRTLEILRREGPGWFLFQSLHGALRMRAEPFDAIELDLGELWVP